MMKIAMVNSGRGWGGAEEQMLAMTRELEHRGHNVTVVCRRGGPIEKKFTGCGHRVLPVVRKGLLAVVDPFRVAAQARAEGFDIIHSHRDHDLPLGKLLALATGGRLLLTQHCLPGKPSAVAYKLADRIIAVSEYIAAGIRGKVPAVQERLGVIVNGIDPAMFANPDGDFWRGNPLLAGRGPLLGVVGGFYKGQEELIDLVPSLLKVFPKLALILIGEDEGRKPQLLKLAETLGVADAVIFAGRIPREQMKDALGGLDLNVSAFRNEGFGLSVIEGFAVGTPFVGYAAGGYREIVTNGFNGWLVADNESMLLRIEEVLCDRERLSFLRMNCFDQMCDMFSLQHMVNSYIDEYKSIKGAN